MSWLISQILGKREVVKLDPDIPCDPEDIEIFTQQKFKDIPKNQLFTFQENGIYFCFEKDSLYEWVFTKENFTNPLTRQSLSDETLQRLRKAGKTKLYQVEIQIFFKSETSSFRGMPNQKCGLTYKQVKDYFIQHAEEILQFWTVDSSGTSSQFRHVGYSMDPSRTEIDDSPLEFNVQEKNYLDFVTWFIESDLSENMFLGLFDRGPEKQVKPFYIRNPAFYDVICGSYGYKIKKIQRFVNGTS